MISGLTWEWILPTTELHYCWELKGNVQIKKKINQVNEKSKISQMKGILNLTLQKTTLNLVIS